MAPTHRAMTPTIGRLGARPTAASPSPMARTSAEHDRPETTWAPRRAGDEDATERARPERREQERPSANASEPKWTRTSHGRPTTVGPVKARLAAVETMTIERMTGSPSTSRAPATRARGQRRASGVGVGARPEVDDRRQRSGAVRIGRTTGSGARSDEPQRARRDGERQRIDGERGTDADERDREAGDRRPDRADQLAGALHDRVGGREAIGRDEPGDERVDRRQEDRVDRPEHHPDQGELPELDPRSEDERGDDRGQRRADDVRGECQVARRDAVRQHPADEHEVSLEIGTAEKAIPAP